MQIASHAVPEHRPASTSVGKCARTKMRLQATVTTTAAAAITDGTRQRAGSMRSPR